jgi:hypothetical protein
MTKPNCRFCRAALHAAVKRSSMFDMLSWDNHLGSHTMTPWRIYLPLEERCQHNIKLLRLNIGKKADSGGDDLTSVTRIIVDTAKIYEQAGLFAWAEDLALDLQALHGVINPLGSDLECRLLVASLRFQLARLTVVHGTTGGALAGCEDLLREMRDIVTDFACISEETSHHVGPGGESGLRVNRIIAELVTFMIYVYVQDNDSTALQAFLERETTKLNDVLIARVLLQGEVRLHLMSGRPDRSVVTISHLWRQLHLDSPPEPSVLGILYGVYEMQGRRSQLCDLIEKLKGYELQLRTRENMLAQHSRLALQLTYILVRHGLFDDALLTAQHGTISASLLGDELLIVRFLCLRDGCLEHVGVADAVAASSHIRRIFVNTPRHLPYLESEVILAHQRLKRLNRDASLNSPLDPLKPLEREAPSRLGGDRCSSDCPLLGLEGRRPTSTASAGALYDELKHYLSSGV